MFGLGDECERDDGDDDADDESDNGGRLGFCAVGIGT